MVRVSDCTVAGCDKRKTEKWTKETVLRLFPVIIETHKTFVPLYKTSAQCSYTASLSLSAICKNYWPCVSTGCCWNCNVSLLLLFTAHACMKWCSCWKVIGVLQCSCMNPVKRSLYSSSSPLTLLLLSQVEYGARPCFSYYLLCYTLSYVMWLFLSRADTIIICGRSGRQKLL